MAMEMGNIELMVGMDRLGGNRSHTRNMVCTCICYTKGLTLSVSAFCNINTVPSRYIVVNFPKTSCSSPVGARYGVSFVCANLTEDVLFCAVCTNLRTYIYASLSGLNELRL